MFDISVNEVQAANMQKFAMEHTKDLREKINFNSFFVAIVVDTNDPNKLGRVKIRIPAIHGANKTESYYIVDDGLPWARPGVFSMSGNDYGHFAIPPAGTRVFVTFEYNSPENPIYFGGIPTMAGSTEKYFNDNSSVFSGNQILVVDNDRIKSNRDSNVLYTVFKSPKGATIEIDDKDGQEAIRIISADGQIIEMGVFNEDKTPLHRRGGEEGSDVSSRFMRLTNGTESIEIKDGEINIKANKIKMNGVDVTPN